MSQLYLADLIYRALVKGHIKMTKTEGETQCVESR